MRGDPSIGQLYRDYGERWEIEPITPGTRWISVLRDSGDYIIMVTAHDVHALRFRMKAIEREKPDEWENGQPGSGR